MVDNGAIENLRVLVVEDESLIAMLIEDTLEDMGCSVVAIAAGLEEAIALASDREFDVAILDVNLNGVQTFPLARLLMERNAPFIFSTGYGSSGIPEAFRKAPVIAKPFLQIDLKRALVSAMENRCDVG